MVTLRNISIILLTIIILSQVQAVEQPGNVQVEGANITSLPTTICGIVTDKLGRPRGNVYIAKSLHSLRNATKTNEFGKFILEKTGDKEKKWLAYSPALRALGLFAIPDDYSGKPIHVILNFKLANVEGRFIGSNGEGLVNRRVELIVVNPQGEIYRSQCYDKTDIVYSLR